MKPTFLYLYGDHDVLTLVDNLVHLDRDERFDYVPCGRPEEVAAFAEANASKHIDGVAFLNLELYGMFHLDRLSELIWDTRALHAMGMHVIYMTKLNETDPGKKMVADTMQVPLYFDLGGAFEIAVGDDEIMNLHIADIVDHAYDILQTGRSPEGRQHPGKET